jgi:hypothetical protein
VFRERQRWGRGGGRCQTQGARECRGVLPGVWKGLLMGYGTTGGVRTARQQQVNKRREGGQGVLH